MADPTNYSLGYARNNENMGVNGKSQAFGGRQRRAFGDRTNQNARPVANRYAKARKSSGLSSRQTTAASTATTRSTRTSRGYSTRTGRTGSRLSSGGRVRMETEAASAADAINPPVVPMAASELPASFVNIDVDHDDPQACSEYAEEIMEHFFSKEIPYMAPANYMDSQPDINHKMRAILIDWLSEVHLKFKLLPETMYMTVNIIDRFLAQKSVNRTKLQLVGVTALLVASKYEEIYPPEVRDIMFMCDRAYSRQDILDMEHLILQVLKFKLLAPYPLHFLRRFSKAANADLKTHTTAKYLMELTGPDFESVQFLPSSIAAAALNLSMRLNGTGAWDATLEHYTRYTEAALMPVVEHLNRLHAKAKTASLKAVYKKYSKTRFLRVATLPEAIL